MKRSDLYSDIACVLVCFVILAIVTVGSIHFAL